MKAKKLHGTISTLAEGVSLYAKLCACVCVCACGCGCVWVYVNGWMCGCACVGVGMCFCVNRYISERVWVLFYRFKRKKNPLETISFFRLLFWDSILMEPN